MISLRTITALAMVMPSAAFGDCATQMQKAEQFIQSYDLPVYEPLICGDSSGSMDGFLNFSSNGAFSIDFTQLIDAVLSEISKKACELVNEAAHDGVGSVQDSIDDLVNGTADSLNEAADDVYGFFEANYDNDLQEDLRLWAQGVYGSQPSGVINPSLVAQQFGCVSGTKIFSDMESMFGLDLDGSGHVMPDTGTLDKLVPGIGNVFRAARSTSTGFPAYRPTTTDSNPGKTKPKITPMTEQQWYDSLAR